MHEDHDHDHHHHETNGHHHHGPGHNVPPAGAVQWQAPHLPHDHVHESTDAGEPDLDLVETAFMEGFSRAPDATSFLRLSGIAFVGEDTAGTRLHLLRVETEDVVDVGAVMPLLGGGGMRYDPLPAKLSSHRRRLAFVYHDGSAARRLRFAEARALTDRSFASRLDVGSQRRSGG